MKDDILDVFEYYCEVILSGFFIKTLAIALLLNEAGESGLVSNTPMTYGDVMISRQEYSFSLHLPQYLQSTRMMCFAM